MSYHRKLLIVKKVRNSFCRLYSSSPIQENTIKIDKWNINYIKVGDGSHHIFCLPGAIGTIWTDFKPLIEGLDKKKFTVVVWDPPGYGKSRPPDKDYTGNYYERDASHAFKFMKALEVPKYSLVGWSDGGVAAMIHAARYPNITNKLVVITSGSVILPESVKNVSKIRDISAWSDTMKKAMSETYGDTLQKYWDRWVDAYLTLSQVNNGNICDELLKDIKCPTYIISGGKDNISPKAHAINLKKKIPGSRAHLYPEGKHNVHIKYAEDFNKRVQDFLLET